MSTGSTSVCNILDVPDEILVKIILYFNARRRLALANSCSRFSSLVFGDKELLRDLDFSKHGRLTTLSDIWRYFGKENVRELVRRVNMQNVRCMRSGAMLNDSIGKAVNLIDVNILGTKFACVEALELFLEPLTNIRRLSIDWPESAREDVEPFSPKTLGNSLSKLTYLSVEVCVYSKEFLPAVQLCQDLEELRMTTTAPRDHHVRSMSWNLEPNKPRSLKVVQVSGWNAMGSLKEHLVAMVPDRREWTDFQLIDIFRESGFYLEKNVEVCEQLRKTSLMRSIPYLYLHHTFDFGWFLISECLLRETIKITHEDAPQIFCCLTPCRSSSVMEEPCLMKIDDAKRLLQDPEYPISFLHFKHSIETDCDAHLVASAFPSVTELVLTHVLKTEEKVSPSRKKTKRQHFQRRLRRRGSAAPEELDDPANEDSSFKMLVENTPNVEDLTIYARKISDVGFGRWDLDALYLIPLWKNLRILRMAFVPVRDGKFLIHIGKECPQLEKMVLENLGFSRPCCYVNDLSQMLSCYGNLKEFSIEQTEIEDMSKLVISLSNNFNLTRVKIVNQSDRYDSENSILAIENLLRNCPKLNTLMFIISWISETLSDELASALRRMKDELNRPNFQFQTSLPRYSLNNSDQPETDIVYQDAAASFFPCKLDGFIFD